MQYNSFKQKITEHIKENYHCIIKDEVNCNIIELYFTHVRFQVSFDVKKMFDDMLRYLKQDTYTSKELYFDYIKEYIDNSINNSVSKMIKKEH